MKYRSERYAMTHDRTSEKALEKRRKVQKENRYNLKDMAQAKRSAGLRYINGRVNREEAEARLAEIPEDTRSLTARMLGDPIPGDPRRPWLNGADRV